jgi:hypothetical protein
MWHPLSAKVGTNSPKSGGRLVGIVRSRTQATEFNLYAVMLHCSIPLHPVHVLFNYPVPSHVQLTTGSKFRIFCFHILKPTRMSLFNTYIAQYASAYLAIIRFAIIVG